MTNTSYGMAMTYLPSATGLWGKKHGSVKRLFLQHQDRGQETNLKGMPSSIACPIQVPGKWVPLRVPTYDFARHGSQGRRAHAHEYGMKNYVIARRMWRLVIITRVHVFFSIFRSLPAMKPVIVAFLAFTHYKSPKLPSTYSSMIALYLISWHLW